MTQSEKKAPKEYQSALITYNNANDSTDSHLLHLHYMVTIPKQAANMCHTKIRKELNTDDAFYISVVDENETKFHYFRCISKKPEYKMEQVNEGSAPPVRRSLKTERVSEEDVLKELKIAKTGVIKKMNKEIEEMIAKNMKQILSSTVL